MTDQAPKILITRVRAADVEIPPPPPDEPEAKSRFNDNVMGGYVRIGGIIGTTLAAIVFFGICALSWMMFYHMLIPKGYYLVAYIITFATFAIAGSVAIGVFFWASIMWLPALCCAGLMALISIPFILRYHHH